MQTREHSGPSGLLWRILLSLFCFVACYAFYLGYYRTVASIAAAGGAFLLLSSDLRPLGRPGPLALLGYVLFSGMTYLWVVSGKFFFREYAKIFIAAVCFLWVMLKGRDAPRFLRSAASVVAGAGALLSAFSVALACTNLIDLIPSLPSSFSKYLFESGTRLYGALANPNVLSSVLALGVILSVALLGEAGSRGERLFCSACLGCCAFSLLLCFSMGALTCFAAALAVYLILAGKGRRAALARMVVGALPTAVFALIAFPCFEKTGALKLLPLLLMAADIVAIYLLNDRIADRLAGLFGKLPWQAVAAIIAAGVVYVAAACAVNGPYTFGPNLYRSAYPAPGGHALSVDATGEVKVTVTSQTQEQTMMHTNTRLYSGPADGASFTVPEGSIVCWFTFRADPGVTMRSASLDGSAPIHLKYPLLPDNIARRIQGMRANQNMVQRLVFFNDGMKLFKKSPILGNSVGFFEVGVASVQDFFYESKYVHNHYIQVLMEDGVIGIALYVTALAAAALTLLKLRRTAPGTAVGWLYPALGAAFVMAALHSALEVSMSSIFFVCMVYAVLAMVFRCREAAEPAAEGAAAKRAPRLQLAGKIAGTAVCLAFMASIACNFAAQTMMKKDFHYIDDYMKTTRTAVAIDLYDRNATKLSFTYVVAKDKLTPCYDMANRYAADLMKVQSNSAPYYLVYYYLNTSQYDQAIRAAMAGARSSASNHETWDGCISLLSHAFIDEANSPLLREANTLMPLLSEYREMWLNRDATAMEPLALSDESLRFFQLVEALNDCGGDTARIQAVLAAAAQPAEG